MAATAGICICKAYFPSFSNLQFNLCWL